MPLLKPLINYEKRIRGTVEVDPRSAIVESWLLVETEMIRLAETKNVSITSLKRQSFVQIALALFEAKIIDSDWVEMLNSIREIRDLVVCIPDMSPSRDDALKYAEFVGWTVNAIRQKGS